LLQKASKYAANCSEIATILQVKWKDPLYLASQLYSDPALSEGRMDNYVERKVPTGLVDPDGNETHMAQYTELNSGRWWKLTQQEILASAMAIVGAIIIPIIPYMDGTWLSNNSNHTAKPCLMGIGNHPTKNQNNVASKKHVCLWFDLGGSQDQRQRKAYGDYKRKLTHDLLYEILGPVRDAQARGGFKFECDGEVKVGFPVMCLFVCDTPERQLLSGVFAVVNAKHPCSMCEMAGEDFPNTRLALTQELRTSEKTNENRLSCLAARNPTVLLKQYSCECYPLLCSAIPCIVVLSLAL